MLEYELKRMVNNDIEYCKTEWENYSFDYERMGKLFEKMMVRYTDIIDGFDRGLNVISGYEKKNMSGDTYRDNLKIIIKRLEAFRDNGYQNEGLHEEDDSIFNITRYDIEQFNEVRMLFDHLEDLNNKDKAEISEKLDEIETICGSLASPSEKWNQLRPYVIWLSGKSLLTASQIWPLLMSIK